MTEQRQLPIEDWFWELVEGSRPSLMKLEAALEALSKEKLEQYMVYYDIASEELCDPWDGPLIDGVRFSEDDTEDLTDWIVSQGREVWQSALGPMPKLADFHHAMVGAASAIGVRCVPWDNEVGSETHCGYQCPKGLAQIIYEERFGDDYLDVRDELHERYDP